MQLPFLKALTSILPFAPAATTPSTTMSAVIPDWKPALESSLSKQNVNYLTLSTVAAPLVPRARLVTFAGFLGDTPVLTTATQKKSQKYHELTRVSDAVEAVFWFAEEWVQVRVKGRGVPLGYYDDEEELGGREKVERYLGREVELKREVREVWERQAEVVKGMYPPPVSCVCGMWGKLLMKWLDGGDAGAEGVCGGLCAAGGGGGVCTWEEGEEYVEDGNGGGAVDMVETIMRRCRMHDERVSYVEDENYVFEEMLSFMISLSLIDRALPFVLLPCNWNCSLALDVQRPQRRANRVCVRKENVRTRHQSQQNRDASKRQILWATVLDKSLLLSPRDALQLEVSRMETRALFSP